eukprot:73289-Chlamydomonas_euryale.AAC.1
MSGCVCIVVRTEPGACWKKHAIVMRVSGSWRKRMSGEDVVDVCVCWGGGKITRCRDAMHDGLSNREIIVAARSRELQRQGTSCLAQRSHTRLG